MRRFIFPCLFALCLSCDHEEAAPPAPTWTAELVVVDSTGSADVEVSTPTTESFAPWRLGTPIPAGSSVRTTRTMRAALALPGGIATVLNHSTELELARETRFVLKTGGIVLDDGHGGERSATLVLPHGEVLLTGSKVAAEAGDGESTLTVSRGRVEVKHGGGSVFASPGAGAGPAPWRGTDGHELPGAGASVGLVGTRQPRGGIGA